MIRRLVFALPELSLNLMFASVNAWFLYYLVTILHLPPLLAGAAFLIGRVLDAVLDFPVGRLSDRCGRQGGRVRLIGTALPFAAGSFVLMWALPAVADSAVGVFVTATFGFALFSLFYTLTSVPRLALLPGYARDRRARIRQVAMDMILAWVAVAVASSALPVAAAQAGGVVRAPFGWALTASEIAVLALLFYIPFLLRVEDRALRPDAMRMPMSLRHGLARLHAARMGLPLVQFLLMVLVPFLLQSMLPFYLNAQIGLPADRQLPVLATVFATALLSFPLWSRVAQCGVGRAQPLAALAAIALAALAMPFLSPGLSPALFLLAITCGVGLSGLALAAWSLVPDTVDRAQMAANPPGEGLATAAFTFVNQLAAGIAAMTNALVLSGIGVEVALIGWGAALPPLACCCLTMLLLTRGRHLNEAA